MAEQIAAVLFDYGLVLTGPPCPRAWQEMQDLLQADESTFAAAYWHFRLSYDRGTLGGEVYWRSVGQELGHALDDDQVRQLIELDTRLWTVLNTPMVDWALRLRAAGTPTGILSNLGDRMQEGVLRELSWMHGFSHSTFSHRLGVVKPDAAIYGHAAEGLGVPPGSILFVDDRAENVAGARAAGMQAIQYGDHDAFVHDLQAHGLEQLWLQGRS